MTARATFRSADLTRAYRTAQDAGLKVVRTEIAPDGRIVLVHEGPASAASAADEALDRWIAKHGQD